MLSKKLICCFGHGPQCVSARFFHYLKLFVRLFLKMKGNQDYQLVIKTMNYLNLLCCIVHEYVKGDVVTLVYDGSQNPNLRHFL